MMMIISKTDQNHRSLKVMRNLYTSEAASIKMSALIWNLLF